MICYMVYVILAYTYFDTKSLINGCMLHKFVVNLYMVCVADK